MRLPTDALALHVTGAVLLIASIWAGYQFGYASVRDGEARVEALRTVLAHRTDTLQAMPEPAPRVPGGTPVVIRSQPAMTPTVFLATIESLARECELSVVSSRELDRPAPETRAGRGGTERDGGNGGGGESRGAEQPGLEVVGRGGYDGVIAFFELLDRRLSALEIRSVRITGLPGGGVEWAMVCVNHTGRAGEP